MYYLYDMYLKTRSNKRRSEDSVVFEILQEKNLVEILNDINDIVYQATGNYVIKTIICIEIYFKIIIVNFASFVHISTHKF